ncbi:MAG TPA: ATP-dependent helicase HrpB [Rectinemataceae bacterium]|nr:ATP-dependent helicase HrpB [Rectinemataceae bacterium]
MSTGPFLRPGAGSDLPVLPYIPAIVEALRSRGILLLSAEPGAGKTSLVPLGLADAFGRGGKVIVVEPRRVAAVSAAARLAELSASALGDRIGYRVRGETRAASSTRIEAVTGGVLIRMLQNDPFLEDVAVLVFDEFHERSLDLDLGLALALEARDARRGGENGSSPTAGALVILVMSATLDLEALAPRLDASLIAVPGRVFPVATRHAAAMPEDPVRWTAEAILELVEKSAATKKGYEDILAFLPGMAEILRVEGLVGPRLAGRGIETLRLHSSVPLAEQRRAIAPAPDSPRRLILATSIAETSLTVPRVGTVVDCGLARGSRFDRRSGLNRLVTERESADRAEQRRGRAGRLGPGLCLRAWPATELLPERSPPEILRADLSGLVLECLAWGAAERTSLRWVDAPPEASWEDALQSLAGLGALAEGGLSPKGRAMVALGVEARLAALVLAGREGEKEAPGSASSACLAAALLDRGGGPAGLDFAQRVDEVAATRAHGSRDPAAKALLEEAGRLASRAGIAFDPARVDAELLPALLARAWPDRLARRVERSGSAAVFMIPAGRRIRVTPPLAAAAWLVVLEAEAGGSLGRLYEGMGLGETEALAALGAMAESAITIEWKARSYRARRIKRAGAIELSSTALGAVDRPSLAASLRERLAREGLAALLPDAGAEAFLARYRFWRPLRGGASLPDFDDASLAETFDEWLAPWIDLDPAEILPGDRLLRALEARLPPEELRRFRAELPERLELPSGAVRPILYTEGPSPLVEGRIHEFYGLREQPQVAGRPLVIRLLSPAGRPVQVTSDLPGFWKGGWAETRKELRGRYPKHDWPEDPQAAQATRKGLKPKPAQA